MRRLLRYTAEVRSALATGQPIVALESTIISHGMRYPENVETALALEAVIRARGAVPAHIALRNGAVCIGLEGEALEALGRAGPGARKASRRDLASVLAGGGLGATTVAGTMACAAAAGIPIFATGGIGGVHRGGEHTLDVSADLTELGRTPVAVVCAGVKSLLDVGRTLEYLETQGVPVVTLGPAGMAFPTFYSPSAGGVPSPDTAPSILHLARMWAASRALGLGNGMVVAVPPPSAVPGVEEAIAAALEEARARGVGGKDITPFLLARVAELTGGASLAANIALVKANAAVAADFAVQLAAEELAGAAAHDAAGQPGLRSGAVKGPAQRRSFSTLCSAPAAEPALPLATVIGGAVLDVLSRPLPGAALAAGTSNPGVNTHSAGGVGRNVAEVLARLQGGGIGGGRGGWGAPVLITALGADPAGAALAASCAAAGLVLQDASLAHGGKAAAGAARAPHPLRTATYSALLDGKGELVAAVADTGIFERVLVADAVLPLLRSLGGAVIADANLCSDTLVAVGRALAASTAPHPPPLLLEPVSTAKCLRTLPALPFAALVKPNAQEVVAMAEAWRRSVGLPPLPPPRSAERGGMGESMGEVVVGEVVGEGEGAGAVGGEEDGGEEDLEGPDARILAAAQSVLAAMLGARSGPSAAHAQSSGLIEGRKHVLVSLGSSGVLWLSAPPLTPQGAELCATLPFFSAAASPEVNFDFQLCHPPPTAVKKVTGAGDTLLACLVWALLEERVSMASALRYGLAGARLALECEPAEAGGGAVPVGISAAKLRASLEDVGFLEESYS